MTEHTRKPTVKQLQKEQENLTEQLMYTCKRLTEANAKNDALEDYYKGVIQIQNDKIETLEIQLAYERSGLFSRIMKKVGLGG